MTEGDACLLGEKGSRLSGERLMMALGQDEFEVTPDRNEGLAMEMEIYVSYGQ